MATQKQYVALQGSDRTPLPGARAVSSVNANEWIEITVHVRRKAALPAVEELGEQLPGERQYLTQEQFEASYGADPRDLEKVAAFAQEHGLAVVQQDAARRSIM